MKLLVAGRLEETRGWCVEGDRTPAHYLARKTGTSIAQAAGTLKAARHMDRHGTTAEALRDGQLTVQQAAQIADACAADPHAEKRLLTTATHDSFRELRDECRRVKAAARDDEIAHDDEIRRSRFVRTWTDRDGAGRGEWKLASEDHARLLARIEADTRSVPAESAEARRADAHVRLAESAGQGGATHAVMHLRVDQAAFERGNTEPGEICEIEGVGPVPVATARNLSTSAVVHALVVDGIDITRVANLGRHNPAPLETALRQRDQTCVVPGCSERERLEIHHKEPVAEAGVTSLDKLERRCRWHHYLATHHPDRSPPDRSPPPDFELAV